MPRHNRNHFDDDEDEEDYYGDEDYYDDDSEPEDETANEDSEPENETAMIQRNICVLQLQKFDLFESQNKETGHFDVTFEIDKKFLHAHKFALAAASKTFQTQFSKRWTEKVNDDEPIKIQNYSYEEFLQLLCFLYSGVCKLTSDNVFSLTDMGEFYDLPLLKEYCDKFMSKLKNDVDIDNVYDKVDFALRYSLSDYLNSIKKFIRQNFESLAKSEQFMIFKKPFVQVMMSVERSFDEEKLLESVYKWAVHQATLKKDAQNSDEFNMAVAIKNELYGIISDVKFAEINLEFVLQFVADKELIFSTSELYTMFYLSFHENREELLFKALYGLAEKEAKAKIACSHNRINLNDLIKAEASKFLSEVNFGGMSFEFIMNFVAKKSFLFTPSELYKIVSNCKRRQDQEAELFKSLVKLAEDQEIEKQKEAMKDNFLLSEAVKNALSENLSSIKFQLMPYKFLFDFVVEKGFFLGPFDISGFAFKSIADSENKEDAFKNVYYLSEKQALRKHKDAIANFPNFKLIDAVKLEMLQAFHLFKFSEMDVEFLKDFIVDKGFIIFPKELRAFFMNSRARYGNEEKAFKAVYEVAEKQAARKQQSSSEDIVILSDTVKSELQKILHVIDFREMSKEFIMNYVVSKGFIPRSTAVNYCGVCVEVKSQEKIIFGSFKDIYGVYNLLQPNGHQSPVRTDRRQRFTKLKLTINKLLPMVKKMKGVEWYLCVEKDGILTVKHNSMIYPTDYLIAEMKQPRDATSEFNLIKSSLITAKHCDL